MEFRRPFSLALLLLQSVPLLLVESIAVLQKPKVPEANKQEDHAACSKGGMRSHRYISPHPDRVLDAPDLVDDFYLNILDWGSKNQVPDLFQHLWPTLLVSSELAKQLALGA